MCWAFSAVIEGSCFAMEERMRWSLGAVLVCWRSFTCREVGWRWEMKRRSLSEGSLLQAVVSSVERSWQRVATRKRREAQEPSLENYKQTNKQTNKEMKQLWKVYGKYRNH